MKTFINYEVTDTFNGEANYGWVKRGTIELKDNEVISDLATIRRVKKAIGWNGIKCRVENYGDVITMRPGKACVVCFITFDITKEN